MPKTKRAKPLYQRGAYALYPRDGRNHEIVWYDAERKRERSISAGASDDGEARAALDRHYLTETKGEAFCPTCGQARRGDGIFVTAAIADYLTLAAEKPSYDAIRARLNHVLSYLVATDQAAIRCDRIDESWVARLRKWLVAQPIISPSGAKRVRSLSTVEGSVHQLAAAINLRGGIPAQFKGQSTVDMNRTPYYRADIVKLVAMFRYCLQPDMLDGSSEKQRLRTIADRAALLGFLRISVTTMARPDAAHDVSTTPERRQWNSNARVLSLNWDGRRQTKKFRATVPVPASMAAILDTTDGMVVPAASVRSAWEAMAKAINLPIDRAGGMKLIRRSVADLVRAGLPQEAWGEVEIYLGHRKFSSISDLYAPFRPDYLRRGLAVVESIVEAIEKAVPGAFKSAPYRADTAQIEKGLRVVGGNNY